MALINNIYVFVEQEQLSREMNITQHPVEKGLPLTDSVRAQPKSISISGKIVDTNGMTSEAIISKLENLRTTGSLINYKGRTVAGNYQIKSFSTDYANTNWGGADFSMELIEVRIAKSAYDPSKQIKKQTAQNKASPVSLKVGARVVFKGGPVYISSDAKKPAVNRGRSTCKITIINSRSWSVHDYHLISTDGKRVYGWVNKSDIEGAGGTGGTSTKGVTNGGKQQVTSR